MIKITKYSTSFSVETDLYGNLKDGNFNIKNWIKSTVCQWDFDTNGISSLSYKFCHFDKLQEIMYIPIAFLNKFLSLLDNYNREYKIIENWNNLASDIDININSKYKPYKKQEPHIKFLSESKQIQRCLTLYTGGGKTFITTFAICNISKKTLIITPANLIEQWNKELLDKSNLKKEDIFVIKGKPSIEALLNNKKPFKIYLASLATLASYVRNEEKYKDLPTFSNFIKSLNVGVKVIDELHLHFHQIVMVDMLTNININIYLSATYIRNNKSSDRLFQQIFHRDLRSDVDNHDRYTNITEYNYILGFINKRNYMTIRGYSQFKYEKYLLKTKSKFEELYEKISCIVYNKYIINSQNDLKLLIIVGLKVFAKTLADKLQEEYQNFTIGTYLSEDPPDKLLGLDIIISTIGSIGVGVDLKGLSTIIVFSSFKAEAANIQILGRIRDISPAPMNFCYMVNNDIQSHLYHRNERRKLFRPRAKNYDILNI